MCVRVCVCAENIRVYFVLKSDAGADGHLVLTFIAEVVFYFLSTLKFFVCFDLILFFI